MKVYNEQSDKLMSKQLTDILVDIRKRRNFNQKQYIEQKTNLLNI